MALRVRESVTVVRGHRPRNNTRAAGIGRGGREPAMLDRAVAHTAHIRTTGGRMVGLLLRLRWLAVVIAVCGALHSLAFTAMGVIRGYEGYRLIFRGPPWIGDESPGIYIAKSIDAFLLALVFFVFAIGVLTLFATQQESKGLEHIPAWMRVKSLSELKFLIWEAILAALVVASVESLVVPSHALTWTALIVPLALLILAAGLFLARKAR